MGHLEVVPDDLSSLSSSLSQFSNAGNDASTALGAINQQHTGHAGLAGAVSSFVHDWDFSLKKIGENAAAIADKVDKAAQGYNMTEDAIVAAASGTAESDGTTTEAPETFGANTTLEQMP
jgi:hypothetical protein